MSGGGWNPGLNDTNGGGGFINDTMNYDTPGGKKKTGARRLQSVVPVVVRQIRDHERDEFRLFGLPAQIVSIVAILKDFEVQSTKATYTVEDHTGSMKVVWWLESDANDSTPKLPMVKEGGYVQVFGTVRVQDGNRNLMVLKMFPIDDCNIITTHLLEVIHTRLQAEAISKDTEHDIKQNNPGADLANSMRPFDQEVQEPCMPHLTPTQLKVYKILQSVRNKTGSNRTAIMSQFPFNQRNEANEALEFLINEGHAYSTIDNEHFKSTEA